MTPLPRIGNGLSDTLRAADSDKPNFAKQYFVDGTIWEAEFVLEMVHRPRPFSMTIHVVA
jgi:hypothetical protein